MALRDAAVVGRGHGRPLFIFWTADLPLPSNEERDASHTALLRRAILTIVSSGILLGIGGRPACQVTRLRRHLSLPHERRLRRASHAFELLGEEAARAGLKSVNDGGRQIEKCSLQCCLHDSYSSSRSRRAPTAFPPSSPIELLTTQPFRAN